MHSKQYKTIFFDWNKTLSYSRFWQQFEDPKHSHHHTGKLVFEFLFGERRDLIGPWMRGIKTTNDILSEVSRSTKIPHDFLFKELQQSCEQMTLEPEGVLKQIQLLRNKGVRCVIATDNMDTFRDFTIPALKLDELFDDFLISNEIGILKFDVDKDNQRIPFFDSYLKKFGLEYEDVVLIDDCTDDGFYANVGFSIIQVNKPEEVTEQLDTILGDIDSKKTTINLHSSFAV